MDIATDRRERRERMIAKIEEALELADQVRLFDVGAHLDAARRMAGDRDERAALRQARLAVVPVLG